MKVCSVCLQCYDDSITICAVKGHSSLTQVRQGNCLIVEGYRIDSRFESGSPVELYKATHLASEKSVLIRFIEADDSFSKLQKELQEVAGINHPNLARAFEFGEATENEFYFVLEDIPGKNLHDYLEESSRLSERQAIKITRQIAEGLEELHTAGVIHRAVNPANIYFTNLEDENFSVKLQNYDFGGIVQKVIAGGANGVDAGTEVLRYFSPEQFTDEKIDFRSDIYSLGIVFYEMLLGRSPYDSLNPRAISDYVFNESDLGRLDLDLKALLAYTLRQSFQRRLDMRPTTTNNFVRQLRHLELIATPSKIGFEDSTTDKSKERQPVNVFQPDKPKPVEKQLAQETIVSNPEPIISDIREEETIKAQVKEEKIETDELKDDSQIEISVESTPDIELIEQETLETVPVLEPVPQSKNENAEQEIYLSESIDWEGSESVEKPINKEAAADRHSMNSRRTYTHASRVNKTLLYIAGILVSAVFGGIFTASILNWQSDAGSSTATQPANIHASKKEDTSQDKTREIADISGRDSDAPQNQESLKNDIRKADKIEIQASSKNNFRKITSRKNSKLGPAKKRKAKRRYKRKLRRKKNNRIVKTSYGKTHPRIFKKVVIYY